MLPHASQGKRSLLRAGQHTVGRDPTPHILGGQVQGAASGGQRLVHPVGGEQRVGVLGYRLAG
jgi:hypothetical protein